MPSFHCSVPECVAIKHEALGLCKRHYRASRPRPTDKAHTVPCSGCGIEVQRFRPQRWGATYCSELCRHWIQWGAWSSKLPLRHAAIPQPEKPVPVKKHSGDFDCWWCGNHFTSNQPQSRYCSKQCASRRSRSTRRAAEHSAPGEYTYTEIMRLYLRQGRVCAYCMLTIDGLPDPEHVVPLSRGGRNDTSNMVAACRLCNSDKGDLTLDEWAVDRERRGLPTVRTVLDSAEYRHLTPCPVTVPAWRHRENTRSIAA